MIRMVALSFFILPSLFMRSRHGATSLAGDECHDPNGPLAPDPSMIHVKERAGWVLGRACAFNPIEVNR